MADFKMEVGGVYADRCGVRQEITRYEQNPSNFNWWSKSGRAYNSEGKWSSSGSGLDLVRRIDTPEEKESDGGEPTAKDLPSLTKHEEDVLRIVSGEDVPGWTWGAAMSECLGALKGKGLITPGPRYDITEEGKQMLDRMSGHAESDQEDARAPIPVKAGMDAVCRNGKRAWVYGKIAPWGWRSGDADQYAGDFESRYTTATNAPVWNADGSHFSDPQFDIIAEYVEPVVRYLASNKLYTALCKTKVEATDSLGYVRHLHKISIDPVTGDGTMERVEEE